MKHSQAGSFASEICNPCVLNAEVFCPQIPNPPNGRAQYENTETGIRPGATIHYTCNIGYSQEGPVMAECQIDGTWSAPASTCVIGKCHHVPFAYVTCVPFGTKPHYPLQPSPWTSYSHLGKKSVILHYNQAMMEQRMHDCLCIFLTLIRLRAMSL